MFVNDYVTIPAREINVVLRDLRSQSLKELTQSGAPSLPLQTTTLIGLLKTARLLRLVRVAGS